MKTEVATYFGRVTCVHPDKTITVMLDDMIDGETIVADMSAEDASKWGLKMGDVFHVHVMKEGGVTSVNIEKPVLREPTEEELARLQEEVTESLKGIDLENI